MLGIDRPWVPSLLALHLYEPVRKHTTNHVSKTGESYHFLDFHARVVDILVREVQQERWKICVEEVEVQEAPPWNLFGILIAAWNLFFMSLMSPRRKRNGRKLLLKFFDRAWRNNKQRAIQEW
jgi:hypothetical protein